MEPKGISPILPETFKKIVIPWLKGIAYGDITVVMSYPASDRHRRFLNLIADPVFLKKYLPKYKNYLWVSIDFRVESVDDVADLETALICKISEQTRFRFGEARDFISQLREFERKTGKKVIFAGFGSEVLINRRKSDILAWCTVIRRYDALRLLLFCETNLFSAQSIELFAEVSAFLPRLEKLVLYREGDVRQFLYYLSKKWQFKIPVALASDIVNRCGGVLFFVKEAARFIRDNPGTNANQVFNHQEMLFNLATFWQALGEEERRVLEKLTKGEKIDPIRDKAALDYLMAMGFFHSTKNSIKINIPLLIDFIKSTFITDKQLRLGDKGEIYLDGIPVSSHFSRKERRVLGLLLSNPNSTVSREQIGFAVWPGDTKQNYSDWAIDSHISRLRKRLAELGIAADRLQTRKGKGFVWQ